jgi:hypothetical protein
MVGIGSIGAGMVARYGTPMVLVRGIRRSRRCRSNRPGLVMLLVSRYCFSGCFLFSRGRLVFFKRFICLLLCFRFGSYGRFILVYFGSLLVGADDARAARAAPAKANCSAPSI